MSITIDSVFQDEFIFQKQHNRRELKHPENYFFLFESFP